MDSYRHCASGGLGTQYILDTRYGKNKDANGNIVIRYDYEIKKERFNELAPPFIYALNLFNLKALSNTDTELKLMAAPAIIGFNNGPPKI